MYVRCERESHNKSPQSLLVSAVSLNTFISLPVFSESDTRIACLRTNGAMSLIRIFDGLAHTDTQVDLPLIFQKIYIVVVHCSYARHKRTRTCTVHVRVFTGYWLPVCRMY